jgi:hypothetical protein
MPVIIEDPPVLLDPWQNIINLRWNVPEMFLVGGSTPTLFTTPEAVRSAPDELFGNLEFVTIPELPTTSGALFNYINGFAYGGGVYIATVSRANAGTGVYKSTDLRTWTLVRTITTSLGAGGVAYGNGVFVVGGDEHSATTLHVSSDKGVTWTAVSLSGMGSGDNDQRIRTICFAEDAFFVTSGTDLGTQGSEIVGDINCKIYRSTNGTTWTSSFVFTSVPRITAGTPAAPGQISCWGVAYNEELEKYCAVGTANVDSFDDTMVAATSTDGITWSGGTVVPNGSVGFSGTSGSTTRYRTSRVAAGNGVFVAGILVKSTNGTSWTEVDDIGDLGSPVAVVFSKPLGTFLVAGTTRVATSDDDGVTWTEHETDVDEISCAAAVKKMDPSA